MLRACIIVLAMVLTAPAFGAGEADRREERVTAELIAMDNFRSVVWSDGEDHRRLTLDIDDQGYLGSSDDRFVAFFCPMLKDHGLGARAVGVIAADTSVETPANIPYHVGATTCLHGRRAPPSDW